MDSTPSTSSSSSKYTTLRPSPLRARSSSIALKPLALAQLSTTRPRSNSGAANAVASSSSSPSSSGPSAAAAAVIAEHNNEDEIGMGVGYTVIPPSPPNEADELAHLSALKEAGTYLPAPVALAIDRPGTVYAAAVGAVGGAKSALGRLWGHKRQKSVPPSKSLRSVPIALPAVQVIPLDVLTPPPSPPPIILDSTSLPLPASSPTTAAFSISSSSSSTATGRPLTRARISTVVLLLGSLFFISTALLLAALYSLPVRVAHFPRTLADLSALGSQLRTYAETTSAPGQLWSGQIHVLTVLAYALLWSNAWSIPGSIVLNVLSGVLLSPISSTLFLTTCTAVGSLLATALTLPAVPLLPSFSLSPSPPSPPSSSAAGRAGAGAQGEPNTLVSLPHLTPTHLVLLRLSGIAPWSLLNIYAALHRTPATTILWTCLVGCAPWCAVTAQIGSLLSELGAGGLGAQSVSEVLRRPGVVGRLVGLSLVGAGPVLMKGWVRGWLGVAAVERGAEEGEEEVSTARPAAGWG